MPYIAGKRVAEAYTNMQAKVENRFWGFLALTMSSPSEVHEALEYHIDLFDGSKFLESIFRFNDDSLFLPKLSSWFFMLSNQWVERGFELLFKERIEFFDVLCWAYRKTEFDLIPSNEQLVEKFLTDFHIPLYAIQQWFNLNSHANVTFQKTCTTDAQLLQLLNVYRSDAFTLTLEAGEDRIVKAHACETARVPFVQTLYSGLSIASFILLTQFDIHSSYALGSSPSRIALPKPTRPLQQVFYGAPGTGKSYAIKHVEDKGTKPIRTTFHPDSDYASFVGAYKPTMELVPPDGQGADKYATKQIVYAFVPQAFLQAYVAAWCHYPEPQYLIIEELNRGHCAQIFGDLFQLLDRDGEGFSEYPVYPDADLQSYLAEALGEANFPEGLDQHYQLEYPHASQELARGRLMALPNNLYIWATMNTSDQSLFPMDSAFKRRWAWHYVPIADAGLAWTIEAAGKTWDWWACLQAINARIEELTVSEDKKLGYFFTTPPKGTAIPAEQFVSKVIFYLFGDVFRDYGMENSLFSLPDGQPVRFSMFYENVLPEQTVDEALLAQCLQSLGLKPL